MRRGILGLSACAGISALMLSSSVLAADPVKIGFITTLSTGAGYLGEDARNGFMLAIEEEGGKLGGAAVELLVEDDGNSPENGRQIAERMLTRENVDLMSGIIFSNVAMAVVPKVVREGVPYISPNAGPSQLAGKMCDPLYFNAAYQNDQIHEGMGKYAADQGYKRIFLLAPNYPAGRDSLSGFKRFYDGEVVSEVYSKLGQTDYAAEIAQIRAANPEAVFFFLPGGMGINFVKQYDQAGMSDQVPLLGPAFSFDETLIDAVGEAALGVKNSAEWSPDLDNEANRAFVAGYVAKYGRNPTLYAAQGYDTARLIASALAAVDGDVQGRKEDFLAAMRKADFDSVRGDFKFGPNQHPIQDIYVREVVADPKGGFTNKLVGTVFDDHQDAYADQCEMTVTN